MEKNRRELLIHILVAAIGGNDVQNHQFAQAIRIVESQAMRDATPAVVAYKRKLPESKMLHDFDLILSHGSLRISKVIGPSRRFAAIAITAKIGNDHSEILRQHRRDLSPQ